MQEETALKTMETGYPTFAFPFPLLQLLTEGTTVSVTYREEKHNPQQQQKGAAAGSGLLITKEQQHRPRKGRKNLKEKHTLTTV